MKIIFLILLCLLLCCCSLKTVITQPINANLTLSEYIQKNRQIVSIQAIMELHYYKPDSTTSVDASLFLSKDVLHIKFYHTGFLAGEVIEKDAVVYAKPNLDETKKEMLISGIRNSFYWWDNLCNDFKHDNETYFAFCDDKAIFLDKQSLLPLKKTFDLGTLKKVQILYSEPQSIIVGSTVLWYQSKMDVQYRRHHLVIKIKDYEVTFNQITQ